MMVPVLLCFSTAERMSSAILAISDSRVMPTRCLPPTKKSANRGPEPAGGGGDGVVVGGGGGWMVGGGGGAVEGEDGGEGAAGKTKCGGGGGGGRAEEEEGPARRRDEAGREGTGGNGFPSSSTE